MHSKLLFIKKTALVFLQAVLTLTAFSREKVTLLSPDQNLKFEFLLEDKAPVYQVYYKKNPILQKSSLGFTFDNGSFAANLKISKINYRSVHETYELVVGKIRMARSHYKEVSIPRKKKQPLLEK